MRQFFLLPLTLSLVACAGIDYNELSTYEIMNMDYSTLCDHAGSRHPRIMQEVERRQLTCDQALDYCTHDMGLRHGTGEFATCVVGVKNIEVQQKIANEQAEANDLTRQYEQDRQRDLLRQDYINRGEEIPWYLR